MLKSKVVQVFDKAVEIEFTECYKDNLKSEKGINLPDTMLNLPALTSSDLEAIPFVCEYADIVGYSFVRNARDVEVLYSHLCDRDSLGVVFKIENTEAFNKLPEILISGMKRNNIGVMIARGDLAVEIGFERISEVQEEILWLCQAAHIPVIWATQVLENLAKTGIPTRAEISDAAHSAQAECVMLNKGPHIDKAVEVLRNVLTRMESHGFKNKNKLRPLGVAKSFIYAPHPEDGIALSDLNAI
jgi:pyruvate kinase